MGSQTQSLTLSNVFISGVSFRYRLLSQSYESDVLSYVECKMAKFFLEFVPESPAPPFSNKLLDMALQVVVTLLERSIDNAVIKQNLWQLEKRSFFQSRLIAKFYYDITQNELNQIF